MSKFADLMNKPLPSANVLTEDVDPIVDPAAPSTEDLPKTCPVCGNDPCTCAHEEPPKATEPASDEEATPLTPEEDQRVDDRINTVATPLLIAGSLSDEEINEFTESVDSDIVVSEGLMTERTIVRFDKNARKAQLYEVAVASIAREKKDPLYRKLETVYKMERILKAKLRKKYNAEATRKVKEYIARAKNSKSGILSRIANKIFHNDKK